MFWVLALSLIAVIIMANSCVTEKACAKRFPADTLVKVSVVYRDTTIKVFIPKVDTIYKYGHIIDTVMVNSGTAHAVSYVKHDTLKLYLWQTDTTLQVKIDSAIKVIDSKEKVIQTYRIKYVPQIYKDALHICIFIFVAAALALGWSFYKRFKK